MNQNHLVEEVTRHPEILTEGSPPPSPLLPPAQGPHSGSWASSTIPLRSVSQKKVETPSGLQATGEVQMRERLAEHSACPLHRHFRQDRSSVRWEAKGKPGMGDPDGALSPPTDHAGPLRPPAVASSKGTGTEEKEKATPPFSQL